MAGYRTTQQTIRPSFKLLVGSIFFLTLTAGALSQEPKKNRSQIQIRDDGKSKSFFLKGKPVFSYNYAVIEPPNGIEKIYRRSGYIHPVYTPQGRIVTDDFSDDHAHQHGVFFAFVKVKVDGKTIDFWNQHNRTGGVEHFKFIPDRSATDHAAEPGTPRLKAVLRHFRWKDAGSADLPSDLVGSKIFVFEEIWTMSVEEKRGMFVVRLTSELKNITSRPVEFLKNHYGPFGIRGASAWRKPKESGFVFLTKTGKTRANGNHSRESWAAMCGKVDVHQCGIAVIGGKQNLRSPQPVRLHPTMPYFSFAPFIEKSEILAPGKTFRTEFRLVTFDGEVPIDQLNQLSRF